MTCKLWILFWWFRHIWHCFYITGYVTLSYIGKLISTGSHFFSYVLLVSKFYELNVFKLKKNISDRSRSLSIKCKHIWSLFMCFHLRKKKNFSHFSDVLLVCKLYKFVLYITTYFAHGQCFIWEFLVLEFIENARLNTTSLYNFNL